MGFIETIAPYVQKYAPLYGIAVCSPIIAQAVLESASGTSELAHVHNYFGLKYRDKRCACALPTPYYKNGSEQNPDGTYSTSAMKWYQFADMEKGVEGYFQFTNISNYANLKGVSDPHEYLTRLKADGYATSLKYVDNLMAVIDKYDLTRYDKKGDTMDINNSYPAKSISYGAKRSVEQIAYIVLHYTGNKTDKAVNNAKYFGKTGTNTRSAGAHYFVDDTSIYQSVGDLYTAYAVGGKKYTNCGTTGGGSMYGKITNTNSLSVEMCSTNGEISAKTIENAASLVKMLMMKYTIPLENVYRHFDVTGKACPGWNGWTGKTAPLWDSFKARLSESTPAPTMPTESGKRTCPFIVLLKEDLNIRQTPNGTISKKNGAKKGIKYTIVDTSGNWGRLKSGAGWISINDKYVTFC